MAEYKLPDSITADNLLDYIVEQMREGFKIQGFELIDTQKDEPIFKVRLVDDNVPADFKSKAPEQVSWFFSRFFGKPTTINNDNETYAHTFR